MTEMTMFQWYKSNGGIFKLFTAQDFGDWVNDFNLESLDLDYFIRYSKTKTISSILEALDDGEINNTVLLSILQNNYKVKWIKEYEALVKSEYNPIHNYDRTEKHTGTTKDDGTVKKDVSTASNNESNTTNTDSLKHNTFNQGLMETDSNENVRSGSESATTTTTDTTTNNNTNTQEMTITASGNIGVTTTQQMLESEIEMRNKHNFVKILFYDVDKILSSGVYL